MRARTTLAVLALTALTACGGQDAASTADPAPEPSTASEPSSEPTVEPSTAPAAAGGATAPGTELALGAKALVPFTSLGQSGLLGVTLTSITAGTAADIEPLGLGDQVAGMTPYFLTWTLTNEAGVDWRGTRLGLTSGLLADGSRSQNVGVIGDFAPCDDTPAPQDFTTAGASYTTCTLELAGAGTQVVGGAYRATDSSAPDTDYGTDPVLWQ